MTWNVVFQVITLIIGSLGGGSAIMLAVTKWGAEILTAKLKSDIEQQHKKEMAEYEKQLNDSTAKLNVLLQNSSYVTQHQYDLEMAIYKDAWQSLFDLMQCMQWVEDLKILDVQALKIENEQDLRIQRRNRHADFIAKLSEFRRIVDANAPFYKKSVYCTMGEMVGEFEKIESVFSKYKDLIRLLEDSDRVFLDQVCSEINKKKELMIDDVRSYLQTLKCSS